MKWVNRANLKEVNEAFIDALKVQHCESWDLAYLKMERVFAVGSNDFGWVGFPETIKEADKLKAMNSGEIESFILKTAPDEVARDYQELIHSRE